VPNIGISASLELGIVQIEIGRRERALGPGRAVKQEIAFESRPHGGTADRLCRVGGGNEAGGSGERSIAALGKEGRGGTPLHWRTPRAAFAEISCSPYLNF